MKGGGKCDEYHLFPIGTPSARPRVQYRGRSFLGFDGFEPEADRDDIPRDWCARASARDAGSSCTPRTHYGEAGATRPDVQARTPLEALRVSEASPLKHPLRTIPIVHEAAAGRSPAPNVCIPSPDALCSYRLLRRSPESTGRPRCMGDGLRFFEERPGTASAFVGSPAH